MLSPHEVNILNEITDLQEKIFGRRLILQGSELRLELSMHNRDKHQGHLDVEYALDTKRKLEAEISELCEKFRNKKAELRQFVVG